MSDMEKKTKEKFHHLLEKAENPMKIAPKLHSFYKGKIQMMPKCAISKSSDFALWYTPGVAAASMEIKKDIERSFELTNRWNCAAVVSDGTRVLGLGDIGPEAALPVMEGKALLFKYLGGVDAFPICLKTKDPEEIVKTCEFIEPSFGAINLEDIEKPKCFHVLEKTRDKLQIPVWHDDQQGTATVILGGLMNALEIVDKDPKEVIVTLMGVGAANIRTAHVLIRWGIKPGNIILVDSRGLLHIGRKDINKDDDPWKFDLTRITNSEKRTGNVVEAFKDADVVIAASKPGPNTIKKKWIEKMADKSIVFACANPIPEIWPWEAEEAGAHVVATGRSDFPNQINNSLGFPAIFRGVLDVRARTVTDEMCISAAHELAKFAKERGINKRNIIPRMEEWEVFPRVAIACAIKSIEQGIARIKPSKKELRDRSYTIMRNAKVTIDALLNKGLIKPMPTENELLE